MPGWRKNGVLLKYKVLREGQSKEIYTNKKKFHFSFLFFILLF